MEGTESIINKIKEDADKKSSSIIDNAKFEGKLLIKDAEKWAEDYIKVQTDILNEQCKEIIERRKTVADLDVRKLILCKKQLLIEKVIDKIYQQLLSMNKSEYLSFIEKNLIKYADENDTIVLSNDNVLNYNDLSQLKVVKDKNLIISKEAGRFMGGVKLIGKLSDKDLSFKSIIDDQKNEIISEISEKLFD